MQRRAVICLLAAIAILGGSAAVLRFGSPLLSRIRVRLFGGRTIDDVIDRYSAKAAARFVPAFEKAGASYPPDSVTLIAFKREKRLELWASSSDEWRHVKSYDICAASGVEGPKLKEGDLQVPEGVYPLTVLNPNSGFHLSIRIDYPNAFDRTRAAIDGRTDLGGDIYLHGKCVSIGCLAMGDKAIEELFVLAYEVGLNNMEIIIAPADLRDPTVSVNFDHMPDWAPGLYDTLRAALAPFGSSDTLR